MMKKLLRSLLAMALVLTMLMMTCAPAMAASGTTNVLRTNASGVRLHFNTTGGGENTKITSVPKGTKVVYLGTANKSWCKVRLDNGLEGYIFKDYLDNVSSVKKSMIYVVTSPKLAAYSKVGSKKVSTYLKGSSMVAVGAIKNGYAHVMTLGGKKYYVKASGIKHLF